MTKPQDADLHIFVDRPKSFHMQGQYIFQRALQVLKPAGLDYHVLDYPDANLSASVSMVHVDLTVVPDQYFPGKANYRKNLNGDARSIHRLLYSKARISSVNEYEGPVIVKTVLNHRGLPELVYRRRHDVLFKLGYLLQGVFDKQAKTRYCPEYQVYDSARNVPDQVWQDQRLMVERFLPGVLTPPIAKCRYDFFLDVCLHTRVIYDDILADHGKVREIVHLTEVPQAVMNVRQQLGLDFGSIDYFEVDGQAIVVDANKTTTCTDDWLQQYPAVSKYIRNVGLRLVELIKQNR